MSRAPKRILYALGGLAGILVLVAATALLVLATDAKHRVQSLVSDALGMEVDVGGRLGIGFIPSLNVTMENVRIRNLDSEVAGAAEASFGIEFLPLLHREIRMNRVELKHVTISVERLRDGRFNFETQTRREGTFLLRDVAKVVLSDATLHYTDQQSGRALAADACAFDMSQLLLSEEAGAPRWKGLSFKAELTCGDVRAGDLVLSEAKFSIGGKDAVFDLEPVTMRVFGGVGSGSIRADFSGALPAYHVHYSLSKFRLAEFFKHLSPRNVGDGPMDFSADVSLKGETFDALTRSAGGKASLHGHDLTLGIGDIDQELARYESSQSFNLVDVGALFFAGPIGLAVTKGYNFASIFQNSGGSSHIRTLVSEWKVEHGVARAQDVAMATRENRIALKGGLDFVNGRFQEVTVAVIDAQGCATVQQKIRGPFGKPEVEKPNVLASIVGPVSKLLGQAMRLFGGKCEVFYAGSVAAPH